MAKDATPDRIRLVNHNFVNDNHREIAAILENEWDASTSFSALHEEYEPHRATFQKVYNDYFGVPETLFGDGVEDNRTVRQIKDDHGSYKDYRELRNRGDLDPNEYRNVQFMDGFEPDPDTTEYTARELHDVTFEKYREGYRQGYQDAMEDMQAASE